MGSPRLAEATQSHAPVARETDTYWAGLIITALYSGGSLSHGPVALYSYTARADTAAVYSLQPIHYTALYAHPLDGAGGVVSRL